MQYKESSGGGKKLIAHLGDRHPAFHNSVDFSKLHWDVALRRALNLHRARLSHRRLSAGLRIALLGPGCCGSHFIQLPELFLAILATDGDLAYSQQLVPSPGLFERYASLIVASLDKLFFIHADRSG